MKALLTAAVLSVFATSGIAMAEGTAAPSTAPAAAPAVAPAVQPGHEGHAADASKMDTSKEVAKTAKEKKHKKVK